MYPPPSEDFFGNVTEMQSPGRNMTGGVMSKETKINDNTRNVPKSKLIQI